jgi:hypothetical protein
MKNFSGPEETNTHKKTTHMGMMDRGFNVCEIYLTEHCPKQYCNH